MSEKRMQWSGKVIVQLIIVVVLIPFSALLIARDWDWWQAWLYGLIGALGFIFSRVWAWRRHPDLLAERARMLDHAEMAQWDRPLSLFIGLGIAIIPIVAGIEHRIGSPVSFRSLTYWIAIALILFGYVIGSWALAENRFFSGVVRIQSDRGHTVVSTGPYSVVRHPGYSGALLTFLATPFFLDSLWALVAAIILAAATLIRTKLEDDFLKANLKGYQSFTKKTRYRLIPGIW